MLNSSRLPEDFLIQAEMPPDSSVIIAFFPFKDEKKGQRIAPFALKNHYKEIIRRLKQSVREAGSPFSDYSKKELRFFSNSPFPEKELAVAAGLGFRGRNTLLITTEYGSRGLLGGMIIPSPLEELSFQAGISGKISCGSCRLCEEACPGGALKNYRLNRDLCLQDWTTREGSIPDSLKDVWGQRIYGCTICQDCCPWNRKSGQGNVIDLGVIDPEPPLEFYLTHSCKDIKKEFKGTALGMSWIKGEHLQRNAILSSYHTPGQIDQNRAEIEGFCDSEDEGIRDAARWVLDQSGQSGN